MFQFPKAEANNCATPGAPASRKVLFGEYRRYALYAVHTRFGAVQWFVADAHAIDDVTNGPAVIRQEDDPATAVAGLLE